MGANTRVLVVGADAMEKDLIQQWITEGYLPNLKTLQERSVWGLSETPPRRYSGAVWPSFYTGVGPGTHGQFIHTEFNTDSYEYKGVRPQHDLHPPFWTEASMSDMRIAVVNMPYAPLTVGSSGMQVIEWGVHDMHTEEGRDTGFATQPPGFKNTIINKYGRDPVGPTDIMGRTADEFVEFRNLLVERINNKTEMVCYTLDDGGWDLFMTMFDECHTVGHQCCHLHDPNHPLHDQLEHDIGDPILDVYVAIDAAFGRIVESAGEDAYILFLGSHGMGPLMDGNSILDDVLRQMERVEESAGLGVLYFLGQTWDALPSSVRHFLRPIRLKLGRQIYQSMTSGDRANRQCFAMPTQDQCGGVRVNLIGREAHGQVAPGPEYDAFTEKLIHDLY